MQQFEKISVYINQICEQIRWKKARPAIEEEMTNHIIDQRDAFIAEGLDEDAATDRAIAETGDPDAIGLQLDRTHRPKLQWGMLAITAVLVLMGLCISLLLSGGDNMQIVQKRLLFTAVGIAVMIAAYFADFTIIGRYPKAVYFSIAALSVVVLVLSPVVNGQAVQAKYAALLFPLAFAAIVFLNRNKGYWGIIVCGIAFLLPSAIVFFVPSVPALFHYAVVSVVLLGIAIHKNWFGVSRKNSFLLILIPIALLLALFCVLILTETHRFARIMAVFFPERFPAEGYMGTMVKELLRGAKLMGAGIVPEHFNEWGRLPGMWQSDFILSLLTATYGYLASSAVITAVCCFIAKGFRLCFKQKSGLGLFVSVAIMLTFTMQVVSYVVYNSGLLLISPLSLPLISYGNTAMIINLGLIGLMLSVFRTGDAARDKSVPMPKRQKFFVWHDGKLTIDFKPQ